MQKRDDEKPECKPLPVDVSNLGDEDPIGDDSGPTSPPPPPPSK